PVLDAGGAAEKQFRGSETRGSAQRLLIVSRFERPDALAKPVEQLIPVGLVSKERLAEVNVGLDETGEHELPGCVDGPPCVATEAEARADALDPPFVDQDVGAAQHVARGV